MKRYEVFFDYIAPDYWRIALSQKYQKNWKLKSMVLDEALSPDILSGTHVLALMELVAITLVDNHTINLKKSLKVLLKLV